MFSALNFFEKLYYSWKSFTRNFRGIFEERSLFFLSQRRPLIGFSTQADATTPTGRSRWLADRLAVQDALDTLPTVNSVTAKFHGSASHVSAAKTFVSIID